MPCPICAATTDLEAGPGREVTHGTVAVTVERLLVQRCPAGHHTAVAVDLAAVEAATAQLVPPAAGGRLRGDRCSGCRAALTMPVRRTVRTVPVVGATPTGVLTLHLDVPATRCPDCGRDQVPRRSQADLAAALAAVLAPEPTPPT